MSKSSPFETVHERMDANFAEYDGWRLPKDFGDVAAEVKALKEKSAAFDLSSFARITVKGAGGDDLMGRLLGAETPGEGKWVWACLGDDAAKNLRVGRVKGNYLICTLPAEREGVFEAVQKCAGESDISNVQITDITDKTAMLGIYGPDAIRAIDSILPVDISSIEPDSITNMSFFMITITILRGSWTGDDGIEVVCPVSAAAMAAGAVAKYHEREGIAAAGMDTLMSAIKAG